MSAPFSLESAEPAQVAKTCGNCRHWFPYRDPGTGRIHPTKVGRCGWPKPKIPMAFKNCFEFGLHPIGVWKDTDAKTCACFEEVK